MGEATSGHAGRGAITLVRHGEPALSRNVRLSAAGYREWWAQYELGGLKAGQTPPCELVQAAANADVLIASTRRRAIESATAVVAGRPFAEDPAVIEAPLPPPPLPAWLKLPPRWWGVISRICWWLLGYSEGQESYAEAKLRAGRVADMLTERSRQGENVLVVAHGFFNLMVGRALEARGWRCAKDEGFRYWSARRFEPPAG
jgi:broad specificity phosphatase PhoE